MPYHFLEVAVTPSVRATQADMGVDQIWLGADNRPSDTFTEDEIAFIASRDSFYMASVSETGWPYVQHRGGKAQASLGSSISEQWPLPTTGVIASISA